MWDTAMWKIKTSKKWFGLKLNVTCISIILLCLSAQAQSSTKQIEDEKSLAIVLSSKYSRYLILFEDKTDYKKLDFVEKCDVITDIKIHTSKIICIDTTAGNDVFFIKKHSEILSINSNIVTNIIFDYLASGDSEMPTILSNLFSRYNNKPGESRRTYHQSHISSGRAYTSKILIISAIIFCICIFFIAYRRAKESQMTRETPRDTKDPKDTKE